MSYEGYTQVLCKNGHLHLYDAYDNEPGSEWTCPDCQAAVAWFNMVDVTNGSWEQTATGETVRIDGYVELKKVKDAVCPHCGKPVTLEPEVYEIPEELGTGMRHKL